MTVANPPSFAPTTPPQREHIVLSGISWNTYRQLRQECDRLHLKMTFDQGTLEIMPPLPDHAVVTRFIDLMIGVLCDELGIKVSGYRDTTWYREAIDRGLEADDCYYIQNAAIADARGTGINLLNDPPPDLAIETDFTRSSIDKESVYAALAVPELWRWDNGTLTIRLLSSNGRYEDSPVSRALPMLPPKIVVEFVQRRMREGESATKQTFRQWVQSQKP
jgi:Uma2 family endonuclease